MTGAFCLSLRQLSFQHPSLSTLCTDCLRMLHRQCSGIGLVPSLKKIKIRITSFLGVVGQKSENHEKELKKNAI